MSLTNQKLMDQLNFIMRTSRYFMYQNKQPFSGQKRVLAILNLADGLTQNYLADILALKPGSLAELLKKLEHKGEIRRETDAADKRVKRVYLTAAGKKVFASLKQQDAEARTGDFFAGLTAQEQTEFSHYLEKIAAGWDDDFKQRAERFVDPTMRIKAMKKWRDQMRAHDYSPEERAEFWQRMRDWRGSACHFSRDKQAHSCAQRHYYEDNRDFWRKFWHNEDDEK